MKRFKNEKGQAVVEFAIVLPILLLILCGIIDFGWLFYNQLSLNNSCREGARFAVVNASKQNRVELIEEKVLDVSPAAITDDMVVAVQYSNGYSNQGDVTITLQTKMTVLTPVLGVFSDGQTRTLTSTVTMKVES